MRTSSATTRASSTTRRRDAEYLPEVTIYTLSVFSHARCVTVRLSWRVKRKRRKSGQEAARTRKKSRSFRVLRRRRRAARRRSSSCVLETPLAGFFFSRVFEQSAKSVNAPPKPKPKTDSNRIKPLFWPNARFPRKRRGTCTRASPAARLGFGRKGTPPALSARASAVRAKARLADGRARPRVPGIREIRRVADFPTRIVASRAASRHPSARCSTLSTSSPSAALWGRSGSPRTWTEG